MYHTFGQIVIKWKHTFYLWSIWFFSLSMRNEHLEKTREMGFMQRNYFKNSIKAVSSLMIKEGLSVFMIRP